MTTRASLKVSILLATLAWPVTAAAQDAHYWTYGYGPIGQLTEGTLVGGVEDLVPAMVAGHVGENRGQADHFAVAFLSRHDSDWDLAYSDVRVSGAAPASASSSTGWAAPGRTASRTASRSASLPSSPTAPSGAGAR